ncbi:MAG: hypothetical protein HC841_04870 [Verrucomicrobiae bacterium]|nr:hypothetical protein [Verrucomicrobiae bacterium]
MTNGRCRLHGGKTPRGPASPHFKTGRYSKYTAESLADKISEFEDGDPLDLLAELQLLRALLGDFLSRYSGGQQIPADGIEVVRGLMDDIRKYVDTIIKARNATALTAAEVAYLVARIPDVVSKYVSDPVQQRRFIADLFGIVGGTDRPALDQLAGGGDESE